MFENFSAIVFRISISSCVNKWKSKVFSFMVFVHNRYLTAVGKKLSKTKFTL